MAPLHLCRGFGFSIVVALSAQMAIAAPYTIRVAQAPLRQAGALKLKLEGQHGPVALASDGTAGLISVYLGRFDTYAEALWYVQQFKANGQVDAKVADLQDKSIQLSGPTKLSFSYFSPDSTADAYQAEYDPQDARLRPIYQMTKTDPEGAKRELAGIVSDETSGTVRGWAMIRLAYLKSRENDKEASFNLFKSVADGVVPATKADRIEAANRCARLLTARHERVDAIKALSEVYEMQVDPVQKADTLTEIAGMHLELARSAKGSFDDVRRACTRVVENSPPNAERARATAELMFLESYVFQSQPDRAAVVELSKAFLSKYANQRKLAAMALYYRSTSNRVLGNNAEAERGFLDIVAMDLKPNEVFPAANAMAMAGFELAILKRSQGARGEARTWHDWLKAKYPDTLEAKRVSMYFHPHELGKE